MAGVRWTERAIPGADGQRRLGRNRMNRQGLVTPTCAFPPGRSRIDQPFGSGRALLPAVSESKRRPQPQRIVIAVSPVGGSHRPTIKGLESPPDAGAAMQARPDPERASFPKAG